MAYISLPRGPVNRQCSPPQPLCPAPRGLASSFGLASNPPLVDTENRIGGPEMRPTAFSSVLAFAVPILGQQIYDIVSLPASLFHPCGVFVRFGTLC